VFELRTLATVATIDTATGTETTVEYENPDPLKATLGARRRAGRPTTSTPLGLTCRTWSSERCSPVVLVVAS
jgi:hypothetical protein